MPLVTVTLRKPKTEQFKSTLLGAVHAALIGSGVPATDMFQRIFELSAEDFRFDVGYPDVNGKRTEDFAIVEILWSAGRSVKVKKAMLADLMSKVSSAGMDPENVMVCFKETLWENWAFAGGRLVHT